MDGTNLTVNVRTRLVWNIARRYTVIAQTRQPIRSLKKSYKARSKFIHLHLFSTCSAITRTTFPCREYPFAVECARHLVHQSLYLSLYLSIYLSIYISVCLYSIASLYLSHSLSIACLSLSLSLYLGFASSNASLRSIFLSCDQPSS